MWLALSVIVAPVNAEHTILVGVLNKGNTEAAIRAWQPTIDYLQQKIKQKFILIPLNFDQVDGVVAAEAVDFLFVQPIAYVALEASYDVSAIATLKVRGIDIPTSTTQIGSIIFTRANNPSIKKINDLSGAKFAAMDPRSLGGWNIALRELKQFGISRKDFSKLYFLNNHEAVIDAVLNGTADAGTVRTGILEQMVAAGKININDIRLVENPKIASTRIKDYPFLYNTRLYPEWPFVKMRNTSDKLAAQVAVALIQMSPKDKAARAANIEGWVTPLNYQPVHDLLRELKLKPYNHQDNLLSIIIRYWQLFAIGLILTLGMAGVTLYVLRLNRNIVLARDALERKAVEQQQSELVLRESEERFRNLVETTHDVVWEIDQEGVYRYISPQIKDILGYTPKNIIGKSPEDFAVNSLEKDSKSLANAFVQRKRFAGIEHEWHDVANSRRVLESSAVPFYDVDNHFCGFRGITRDVTSRKIIEESLFEEKERLHVTLESITDGVITTGSDGLISYINPSACNLTGWISENAQGKKLLEVLNLVVKATNNAAEDPVARCMNEGHFFRYPDMTRLIQKNSKAESLVEVRFSPLRNRLRQIVGVVVIFHDVTELYNLTGKMAHQATHDALTGLINRIEFERHLQEAIDDARGGTKNHVLCYLDLDQFKLVNDTCGHIAGDELLRQLGHHLQIELRTTDILARLGGDEFGVLLKQCSLSQAKEVMESLRQMVKNYRFFWQGKGFEIGVSIGVVPITAESGELTEVLSAADSACYVAKDSGRNRIYVSQLDDSALAERHGQMLWVHRIRRCLEENRFILHYQAITSIGVNHDHRPYGELLLRMLDERGNIISPTDFIPAAERYHLMVDIDRWVVKHALNVLKTIDWPNGGRFAINLSGQSLCDEHFTDYVVEKIKHSGIAPARICLEITETAAIANLSRAKKFITVLKSMGCKFALDDFGSGLSSFGYLKSLAVDYVKIDGRFVLNMLVDPVSLAMIESINQIAHLMGLKTIAEYVENQDILNALKLLGVDYVQGHGVHIPLPLEEIRHSIKPIQERDRLALH